MLRITINPSSSLIIPETIKKSGSEYCLKSHTNKNLGCYPNKSGAQKREKQVNYFKHLDEAVKKNICNPYSQSNGWILPDGSHFEDNENRGHEALAFDLVSKDPELLERAQKLWKPKGGMTEALVLCGFVRCENAFMYHLASSKTNIDQWSKIYSLLNSCRPVSNDQYIAIQDVEKNDWFINKRVNDIHGIRFLMYGGKQDIFSNIASFKTHEIDESQKRNNIFESITKKFKKFVGSI